MADSPPPQPPPRGSPMAAPAPAAPPPLRRPPVAARAVPERNGSRPVARRSPPQPSPDGFSASRVGHNKAGAGAHLAEPTSSAGTRPDLSSRTSSEPALNQAMEVTQVSPTSHVGDGIAMAGVGIPHVAGLQAIRGVTRTQPSTMSPDPALIRTAEVAHTALVGTPPNDEGLSSGSPSARTPLVEVLMPMPSSTTAKRARASRTESPRIDQAKRARCVVGSPTLRIINQIQMSTQTRSRSPRSTTDQKSHGTRTRNTTRQLRSVYWKEFEPIIQDGEIVRAKCMHCHDHLSGKQNIGTSHLKKHLDRCKLRAKLTDLVDKLRAGGKPADIDLLDNWVYDSDLARRALVRMIVLHEFPFSIVEYDGFREFVSALNPLLKMVSRTTIRLDCMRTIVDAKLELKEVLNNSSSKVSLTADMWTSNQTLGYLCVTCHMISREWKMEKRIIKFVMI
ncbi:hypothetical protein BS78_04G031900 [Paspalum vaginatum]|nr:hypothetical protein BS78_04G031900 [Paspalum vaginatum]